MTRQPRIVLHIGAGKCGSTALQNALSGRPEFTSASGQRFAYVVLSHRFGLLMGDKLVQRAQKSHIGALSTPNVRDVAALEDRLSPHIPALRNLMDEGIVPILSNEGWGSRAEVFAESGFIEKLGGGAKAVYYVRPPVDWLNSAWWQWGVWTKADLDRYIDKSLPGLRWHRTARAWAEMPGVDDLAVGLATRDVTQQFFATLDAPAPPPVQANTGIPASFLLFLQRNRGYRPDAHTPRTEFIVASHLPKQRYPTPWVMGPEQVEHVFETLGDMPKKLRRRLGPEDRTALQDDTRWWTPEAYAARSIDDLAQYQTPDALTDLIVQLRAGLGETSDRVREKTAAQLAAASDPVAAGDALIAAAVDQMVNKSGGFSGRAFRALAQFKR